MNIKDLTLMAVFTALWLGFVLRRWQASRD